MVLFNVESTAQNAKGFFPMLSKYCIYVISSIQILACFACHENLMLILITFFIASFLHILDDNYDRPNITIKLLSTWVHYLEVGQTGHTGQDRSSQY